MRRGKKQSERRSSNSDPSKLQSLNKLSQGAVDPLMTIIGINPLLFPTRGCFLLHLPVGPSSGLPEQFPLEKKKKNNREKEFYRQFPSSLSSSATPSRIYLKEI